MFRFAAAHLGDHRDLHILSFGCSRGEEVCTLRKYFPRATIKGIDIDPRNIARAVARPDLMAGTTFEVAATTEREPSDCYHAIFCLAVLCHGDLTTSGAQRCDPLLRFDHFERMVADFARCLKPGGLLLLHTTNFRFSDTTTSRDFEAVLDADPAQLAPDVLFDRDNRLMKGAMYRSVAFRKLAPTLASAPQDRHSPG